MLPQAIKAYLTCFSLGLGLGRRVSAGRAPLGQGALPLGTPSVCGRLKPAGHTRRRDCQPDSMQGRRRPMREQLRPRRLNFQVALVLATALVLVATATVSAKRPP